MGYRLTYTQYTINVTSKLIEPLSLRDNPTLLSIMNCLYEESLSGPDSEINGTYRLRYTMKLSDERPTYSSELFITRRFRHV